MNKFVTNADEIILAMNPVVCETPSSPIKEICNGAEQSSHVLGLKADHVKDSLVSSRGVDHPFDKAITQRTVLSFVSSVFELIGLVAPDTVTARLLLKDIRKIIGQSWDNQISEDIRKMFREWHSDIPQLGQLTISRCFFLRPVDQIELHMIRNSSQDAFCAVGFLRARLSSLHKTQISFSMVKLASSWWKLYLYLS